MTRSVLFTTAVVAAALAAPSASALQFQFALDIGGSLYPGFIETTGGSGLKSPDNGGLLAFNFSYESADYAMEDDVDFPDFPQVLVSIDEGRITGINYLGNIGDGTAFEILFQEGSFNEVTIDIEDGDNLFGTIRFLDSTPGLPDAGATTGLLALGMAGLMVARRRAKA